jgi:FtsH-binding integral membrane protein
LYTASVSISEREDAQKSFFYKVYGWMACALALTALVSMQVAASPMIQSIIFGIPGVMIGLIIVELALVLILSWAINKLSAAVATIMFFAYAATTGLTLSVIFLTYTKASIASAFFVTAGTFAVMSFYGYVTKKDLTSWGNLLFMALIGIVIASLVNIFLHNSMLGWIITYAGVLIFVGLTAYDTQRIKEASTHYETGSEGYIKVAVMGALMLYLDFINLFLMILRIMGRRD